MRARPIGLVAIAGVFLALAAGGRGGAAPEDLGQNVESFLAPLVESRDFSGVVLIAHGDRVLFEKAWGQASFELGVPMSPDTRFDIASLSKTFTAGAVLMLVKQGKLSLEDPLDRFLPELPGSEKITIRMLLLHQSGLPEESTLPDYRQRKDEPLTLEEAVSRFTGRPLEFEPGTDGTYSNTGYLVLARIVERITGRPFETFLEHSILRPLGMQNTGLDLVDPLVRGKARGQEPGPPPNRLLNARSEELSHDIGSGAMFSTARDLHRWLAAVDSGELFALFEQAYPYGWGRREYFDRHAIEQSGIVAGFLAEMILFPDEDLHVVYLTNIQSGVVFGRLLRGLAAIALGQTPEPIEPPQPAVDLPGADIPGTFRLAGPGEFSIVRGPGGHYLRWQRFGSRAYLDPLGADRFFDRKDNSLLAIRRDDSGRAVAVVWNPGPKEAVAPTIASAPAAEARLIPPETGTIPVAFVLSPGATMIDFAGPWEVFQDARVPGRGARDDEFPFRLFTVSETQEPIETSGGMRVVPAYSFTNAPQPRIIVVGAQAGSPGLVAWLQRASRAADLTMSVCTGAFKLAQAGLLDGRRATTHHDFLDRLASLHPAVDVQRGPRWVESRRVATAGGLTSGIDLALHVVARYFGDSVAASTAQYMEYKSENWKSEAGLWDATTAGQAAREAERRVASAEPRFALGGLDPVLLTQGEERKGSTDLSVKRGLYRYAFASETTRARFLADPVAFEIQLEGACAAMAKIGAPPGSGDPDRFVVHDARIYVFASESCRENFVRDPARYVP